MIKYINLGIVRKREGEKRTEQSEDEWKQRQEISIEGWKKGLKGRGLKDVTT